MDRFPKLRPLKDYLCSLESAADLDILEGLLEELELKVEDVAAGCIFDEVTYVRNVIGQSEWFDLVLMCWRPGQVSPIHDHAGSSCAFKVLKGQVTEVRFEPTKRGFARPTGTKVYSEGFICSAYDTETHQIINNEPGDLVTLHIYSPPLAMNFYTYDPHLNISENLKAFEHKARAGVTR